MSRLQEFISKSEGQANELIRCGSCQNILLHCGKYEIVQVGEGEEKEEGILCEICRTNNRKLEIVIIISSPAAAVIDTATDDENNNHHNIYQIPLSQVGLELLLLEKAEVEEEQEPEE
ncbi:MAG TPA: hypothetical protein VFP49_02895 [Nitrososphaeraceae archaeon]|nr:hypothetical protein [Nitrososphaeraceae archaeon]